MKVRRPAMLGDPHPDRDEWQGTLDEDTYSFLLEHRVWNRSVIPLAAYIELAFEASRELGINAELHDIEPCEPLFLDSNQRRTPTLKVAVEPGTLNRDVRISSRNQDPLRWVEHAGMRLVIAGSAAPQAATSLESIEERSRTGRRALISTDATNCTATTGAELSAASQSCGLDGGRHWPGFEPSTMTQCTT